MTRLSGKGSTYKAEAIEYTGSIPGLGRFLGGGNSNLLQYSCLENLMGRGAWQATVHGVAKSQTKLSGVTGYYMSPHTCYLQD